MFAAYVCIVLAALAAADAKKIVPIIGKGENCWLN